MVVKNKIFMVYNHYNLQVFNCENYENKCFLVSENINNDIKELRGGTPYPVKLCFEGVKAFA